MIKSYTLANWDGSIRDVPQETASYPPSSSTSLPPGQSPSNCSPNEKMDVDIGVQALGNVYEGEIPENMEKLLVRSTSVTEVAEHKQNEIQLSSPRLSVITTSTALDASGEAQNERRVFIPILDSPLHAYHASKGINSAWKSFSVQDTMPNHSQLAMGSRHEAISVHSTAAEGEADVDTDDMAKDLILPPFKTASRSHTNPPSPTISLDFDSLFTPPPFDRCKSVECLFTPEPPRQAKPTRKRRIMSHVEVPSLKNLRTEYKRIFPPNRQRKSIPISKAGTRVHQSLGDALQASMDNNESLGTLPIHVVDKKKTNRPLQVKPKNATPGPSRLPVESRPSMAASKKARKKHKSAEGNVKEALKKKPTTRPVHIDLTLSDVEMPVAVKSKPPPLPPPEYDTESERTIIVLESVVPVDSQVLSRNTRLLGTTAYRETPIPTSFLAPKATYQQENEAPWFLRVSCPSTIEPAKISLGTPVSSLWEPKPEVDEVEDSDDEVEFVETPAEAPVVAPPRIDLAAQILKRRKSNVQKAASKTSRPIPSSLPRPSPIATATSSLSTLTSHSHLLPLAHAESEIDLLFPAYPSEKALGKRKAITPEPFEIASQPQPLAYPYHPPQPTSHPFLSVEHVRDPNNLDIFIHNFGHSPPSNRKSSASYHASIESPSRNLAGDVRAGTDPDLMDIFLEDSLVVGDAAGSELYSQVGDDDDGLISQQGRTYSWPNISEDRIHYQIDTVDPTLLGGLSTDPEFFESEFGAQSEPESTSTSAVKDKEKPSLRIPIPTVDYSSSSSSSSSRAPSPVVEQKLDDTNPPAAFSPLKRKRSPSVIGTMERRPQRRIAPRLFPDMVPSTNLRFHKGGVTKKTPFHLPGSSKRSTGPSNGHLHVLNTSRRTSTSSEYVPTSPTSEGSASRRGQIEPEIVVRHRKATEGPLQPALKPSQEINLPPKLSISGPWPTTPDLSSAYCHQCRRKTNLLKLYCACTKMFCIRCLTVRYPTKTFSYDKKVDDCPYCKKFCNCTSCCAKRREVYVSSRGANRSRPPGHRPNLVVSSEKIVQKQIAPSEPVAIPQTARYWATMYDMEGRKIGPTFATPTSGDGDPQVVFAKIDHLPQAVVLRRLGTKQKRVFIGTIQGSWGLGRRPKVRLLNPVTKSAQPTTADIRASGRLFVGSRFFLQYKIKKRRPSEELDDDDDLLRSLSPLTSLEASEEEDGQESQVAVSHQNCLTEHDVSEAIYLALQAIAPAPSTSEPCLLS